VRLGDAVTQYFHVTVIPRPAVESFRMEYDYPAYTGRSPLVQQVHSGDISALAGSKVTVTAFPRTEVTGAEVRCGDVAVEASVTVSGEACTFMLPVAPRGPDTWSIRMLRNVGGKQFSGDVAEYALDALSDARPSVEISLGRSAAASFTLNRKDRPTIHCRATDDFGISKAQLLVAVDGVDVSPLPVKLEGDAGSLSFVGSITLDLAGLKVATARMVQVQIRVLDNRSDPLGGPQEGLSEIFEIKFDDEADYLRVQLRLADEILIREILQDALTCRWKNSR